MARTSAVLVTAPSVMYTKSPTGGGLISWYLLAIYMAVTPSSCSRCLVTRRLMRNRSRMLTQIKIVSGAILNLLCMLISQSTRMSLIR